MNEYTFIEKTIKEMFENACKLIITENLDEPEFNLCKNTIHTTLTYLAGKREKKEKE